MISPFTPSAQQEAIFQDIESGEGHTVMIARAGCGKSSTILAGLDYMPKSVNRDALLVAFNKSIADELKGRAPQGVTVSTLHSYGLRQISNAMPRRPQIDADKMLPIVKALAIPYAGDCGGRVEAREVAEFVRKVASLAKGDLASKAEAIDALIDQHELTLPEGCNGGERPELVALVQKALDQSREEQGTIDFDDMIWLPSVLKMGFERYQRVFVDETQDLNPAQIRLALKSCADGGRILAVGDPAQCHPPGTMIQTELGMVAVENLMSGDTVAGWNRHAQKMVNGRKIKIKARPYFDQMQTVTVKNRAVPMTPNHKVLARWTDRKSTACVVYLMFRKDLGFRVGWCQLLGKQGGFCSFHLGQRARLEKADRAWILSVHASRTEASTQESIVAARYGLPTITFEPLHIPTHQTRKEIKRVFRELEGTNFVRGNQALQEAQLDFDLPMYPHPKTEAGANVGRRMTYFPVYACNVLPGLMSLPLPDGRNTWGEVKSNTRNTYRGNVYSLDVEKDHSYAANGVVVLNSIYAFRGADADAIGRVVGRLVAKTLPLSITYRCAKAIVRVAQRVVPDFEASSTAPEGVVRGCDWQAMLQGAQPGDFILSRTNAPLVKICFALLKEGRRANIQGRNIGEKLASVVRRTKTENLTQCLDRVQAWKVKECERLEKLERDVTATVDTAECILAISEGCGSVADVLRNIDNLFGETAKGDSSKVVLSSTHKAKGLERDRVWMLSDTYMRPRARKENGKIIWEPPGVEEQNLFYVAVTRAKRELVTVEGLGV